MSNRQKGKKTEILNLEILTPSRKKLKPGDIFVIKPKNFPYYFGRIICIDAKIVVFKNCILIYIYNATSNNKMKIPGLCPSNLLIPPCIINRLPWSRGYFETIENRPLTKNDVLPIHCFRDIRNRYFNEYGIKLKHPVEPIGDYALNSYRTIDDDVSRALGIPLAPD